ncbi:uncharacterized protein LOC143252530 isoform X2 [Tachypleus tridentatus]|uniref:uncharacterized protein LOC143252530 isoform X2 n=1 Tax=Tachypleus tridentatus TaxID=6853 RepID=UPI003FCFC361
MLRLLLLWCLAWGASGVKNEMALKVKMKNYVHVHNTSVLPLKYANDDVKCPDGTTCPDDNTCCEFPPVIGPYGCCPLPQAECCTTGPFCCPTLNTCCAMGCCPLPQATCCNEQDTCCPFLYICCPGGCCPKGTICGPGVCYMA